MHIYRLFLSSVLVIGIIFIQSMALWAGQAQLSWNAPTTNADANRTPLTDLSLYKVHAGTQSRGSTSNPAVFHYPLTYTLAASQTAYTVTGLTEGVRYYFAVTAIDLSGNESQFSPEVNMVVPETSGGGGGQPTTLLNASFNNGVEGFTYLDNTFRNTGRPAYASGVWSNGSLQVTLGNRNDDVIANGMSGGWRRSFTVAGSGTAAVTLSFRYHLSQTPHYESDEYRDMLVTVGQFQLGLPGRDYVARVSGNGNGGSTLTTGWQTFTTTLQLPPGTYALTLGGYNSKKTYHDEATTVLIDDVRVTRTAAGSQSLAQQAAAFVAGGRLAANAADLSPLLEAVAFPSQHIWLEADAGQLTYPVLFHVDDTGTVEPYLWTPPDAQETLNAAEASAIAQYTVTVAESGPYILWGRLDAASPGSFFFTVNNDFPLVWELLPAEETTDPAAIPTEPVVWQWQQAAHNTMPILFLEAGPNTLTITPRQAGLKLSRLLITNDLDFIPQD
jgi:hypothetical protein